ncbi:MAG: TIGR03960 family B12-binding radical SAM protein [Eubacteriales bacterium]|nr:TIGR03960 family B12-binding radical SAM protein [Bacillota bacterium]MBV1726994.1 TIGR03960 family B12-binding radical SAM protein [Desulforudis sp.]MDP3051713.1 TIGR03960 family B12-binding radical SAM protein [Eubacteriales bacterium]MDQ7789467.1 TIGR03960 family B12-binding radical SAM protein [Clostridia bacterium]MBU4534038.1 TIGR03960 family B12-binding radical SAM protein [Bacillota bacterium]
MNRLEHILPRVEKPGRYTGGEYNSVEKKWEEAEVKVAFAFPDVYEVGMSHLGLQILYHVVNRRSDALLERVFAPWTDMEEQMRTHGIPLFALESHRPIRDFDVLAFTLQYELSFSTVLNMLDLSGISLWAKERTHNDPIVIAGGPCAYNPEPVAPFLDAVFLGEGEEGLNQILEVIIRTRGQSREEILVALAQVPGVYVPQFYDVHYRSDGVVSEVVPNRPGVPDRIVKQIIADLNGAPFPTRPIVPYLGVVHDRAMLEVFRGCTRGCRFCQAGAVYRPVRERNLPTLLDQARELLRNTGYDELSLTSLSTSDYSRIGPLVENLVSHYAEQKVNVALPSLRVDAFSVELASTVQKVRRSSLTFAPEAGSQRLRDVINKGVTEENLLEAVGAAFTAGWQRLKLYFMLGLPSETLDDVEGIAGLADKVLAAGREARVPRGRLKVTVSASSFVPKPHTPFQWEPQAPLGELRERQSYLMRRLKGARGSSFSWHEPEASFLEAVFARGDRRLADVLARAHALGCRLDGWRECFRYDLWRQAFAETGINPEDYAYRRYAYTDTLPWDHLDPGIGKQYLVLEHRRAMTGETTDDCRHGSCTGCGLCPAFEVEPYTAREPNEPH